MVAFDDTLQTLFTSIPALSPAAATEVATDLMPLLRQVPWGVGSGMVRAVGALCDRGVNPSVVLPTLVDRAIAVLADVEGFKTLAAAVGFQLPEVRDIETFNATAAAILAAVASSGIDQQGAMSAVEAWFAADDWVQPVLYLSQRKDSRLAMPRRQELLGAVDTAEADIETAHWLKGLLLVLDDEPLLVLHRATSQGWRCTISGIGDNFQLHT
ncbi:MAG: hypothetical protein JWN03_7015, partial [Nocardia sp.]|uniref:hypothetical protein n=1 Tax=Nocardia sp. TaxID=1821 RepID=UPI00261C45EC